MEFFTTAVSSLSTVVTAIGAGVILLMGRKMNLRGRNLVQEASNLESGHGVVRFVRSVFLTTLIIF